MQDLIKTVHSAGSAYDARLMLWCNRSSDSLSDALRAVKGVRNPGLAGEDGVRLVTFYPDQRTMWSDLQKAAQSVGSQIGPPPERK